MKKNNVYIIIGARPQFIKYAPLSHQLKKIVNANIIVIHTGQHFDNNMSKVFFDKLNVDPPTINLNINNLSRGEMIGEMIKKIDNEFRKCSPDIVVLFGDTNSTLSGAVAASSYQCEIIHVESGLRSFNKQMPEEHNRIVADHLSTILFVSSEVSKINLIKEGISEDKIIFSGDIMLDTFLSSKQKIFNKKAYEKMELSKSNYIITTIHRLENTSDSIRLKNILKSLNTISKQLLPVVFPIHPATKKAMSSLDVDITNIIMIDPCDYITFLSLVEGSNFVITDSGGLQKDAYYLGKKTLVFRNESEWPELKMDNASILVNPLEVKNIINNANKLMNNKIKYKSFYGEGNAASIISNKITEILNK
tara:strand:+ start:1312 stop:2403 length:1092 start_codon:yes stop_codon:yes gene_type:complete